MDLVEDLESKKQSFPYMILGADEQSEDWIKNEMIGYPTSYVIDVNQMKIEVEYLGYSKGNGFLDGL